MKCTWLGQAGLLFDFDGMKVMIDPYLSDSLGVVNPAKKRRVAVNEAFFEIKPDVLILTHDHLDHTDPETLKCFLEKDTGICVLASRNAWERVRTFGGDHNYVMFDRGTQWTQGGICFQAVHAQHSDETAIGVLIRYQEMIFYVTGDTLYHDQIIEDVKKLCRQPDAIFLPVNGVGNNMNMTDASRFAQAIGSKQVVPIHFGLLDDLDPGSDFQCCNKVIPRIYQEIIIDR